MPEVARGDRVLIEWGLDGYVEGDVEEVYGPPARQHVLVRLTPEVSGDVVDEPVSISVPVDAVRQAETA
jgi:hypothetical protein